jgi:hypothetical protein
MAMHAPAHQLGTAHHPHTLRYALVAVAAAIVVVSLLVVADVVRVTPSSGTTAGDKLMAPAMVEFRAAERAVGYPSVGTSVAGDKLMAPAMVEFRAGERAVGYPAEYNGPH